MKSLLTRLFSRTSSDDRSRSRRRKPAVSAQRQLEQLEQRLAMTINIFAPSTAAANTIAPWAVVISDNADNVYFQQVASAPDNLLIADNSSFLNPSGIANVNGLTSVYVTNGTATTVPSDVPADETAALSTQFLLHRKVNLGTAGTTTPTPVRVIVSYAGNTWTLDTNGAGGNQLTLVPSLSTSGNLSDPNLVRPTGGFVSTNANATISDAVTIFWSRPPRAAIAAGISAPQLSATFALSGTTNYFSESALNPSSGALPTFSLPVTGANPGGIIPGTLTGVVQVDGYDVSFRMNNLFTPLPGNITANQLFFGNENSGGSAPSTTGVIVIQDGTTNGRQMQATGYVDYDSGRVFLDFRSGGIRQNPGSVVLQALSYAVYNQDAQASAFTVAPGLDFSRELFVDQLTPGSSININSPILQSGTPPTSGLGSNGLLINATNINVNAQVRSRSYFDVNTNRGVLFEHPLLRDAIVSTASAQAIVSPLGEISAIAIPAGGGGQGYDNDPANAPTVTITGGTAPATGRGIVVNGVVVGWVVDNPGAGFPTAAGSPLPAVTVDPPPVTDAAGDPWLPTLAAAVPEQISFNAAVAAPTAFSFVMGDDPSTLDVSKGRLYVSATGSLSGALATSAAAVTTPSGALEVRADTADLIVEGTIFATSQTYLMQSTASASALAPFVFTTVSPTTGANTGLIRGTTVAVTLGNDMPTPEEAANAASVVNLRTQINSMRIAAATSASRPLAGPYPYELTITELDSISFDAVAASSLPITLSAAGTIDFTSAMITAGDLTITAGSTFTVAAPLSTSRGQINISGQSITVANSVRVLDPASDDTRDDIVLTATGGDLSLTGTVSAVNNVRLVQRNKSGTVGKLGGQTRVIANGVVVDAEGGVDLKTDAVTLEGRSGGDFSLDELNNIAITSLRAPGFVTLTAGGTDPGANDPTTPNTIALDATLTDVVGFSASAPRGSVHVVNNVAKTMTLGDATKIAAGTATSMQAAGSAVIRSTAGSVTVNDAPLGGGSAIATRVATTANLAATFAYNTPGTFASTLTGSKSPLVIDGVVLKAGDRVLVKNQTAARENGVYVVTTVGSSNTAWRLTRATDADTSTELPANMFIQVAEGSSAGRVFTISYTPTDNLSPIAVTTVANRADATRVRAATTSVLGGTYNSVATTITSTVAGSLPAIGGVTLSAGDLVLVRLGATAGGAAANGVYEVTDVGGVGTNWVLTRALDPDSAQPLVTGYVVTTDDSFRASVTGQAFLLGYDSLGNDPMTVSLAAAAGRPLTDIGTDNVNSSTTFVVSSTAGTNASAGSLGKMISLRQANDVTGEALNPDEVPGFVFAASLPGLNGAAAGVIRLTQELPAITKAFAIDGSARTAATAASNKIVIDGSRIVTTRFGGAAANATEVNGFSFETGSGAVGSTAGASLANMTVGGFAKGSAVKINGAPGILVKGMTLGRDEAGGRLTNSNGVRITGNATGATVMGGTIVGSTAAGVRVDAGSTGYAIVGTTLGAVNQNNNFGIDSAGSGRIGVTPLANTSIDATTTFGSTTITLPATVPASAIHLGQTVSGAGIPAGATIVAIDGTTITLSAAQTATAATKLLLVDAGRTVVEQNLTGINLAAGSTVVTNSDIRSNTYNGVTISGGTQTIGASTTRSNSSNSITSNGRWGVNVVAATAGAANTLLATQKIQGNVFASLAPNKLGNVGVGTATASTAATGAYVPNATTNIDTNGNLHTKTSSSSSGSGSTGGVKPPVTTSTTTKYPWRVK